MGEVVSFDRARLQVVGEREAAAIVGLSYATLRRMRLDDIGPRYVQLGVKRIGYRQGDLAEWLDRQARGGGGSRLHRAGWGAAAAAA